MNHTIRAIVVGAVITLACALARAHADPLGEAAALLYGSAAAPTSCREVECLLADRYARDPKARALALELWRTTGDLAGVGSDELMEGGYRGQIHLVPQLPIGTYRNHLVWTLAATAAFEAFFTELYPDLPAPHYRWKPLAFRFVHSPGKRTPSAYATTWSVTYNVDGSLLTSADGVRETLFHELFHDNDQAHGDWSAAHLQTDYAAILARCGAHPKLACLTPYAPNSTIVRGGTYYAFQPNNGDSVHEYAAELAVRYYNEQTEMLRHHKLAKRAFKCGPAENARAWAAFVDEFFAGRDLVPSC